MVEQQELKSYQLLSSSSELFYVNDPRWDDMWYIVSEKHSLSDTCNYIHWNKFNV